MEENRIWTGEEFYKLHDSEKTGCFNFVDGSIYYYKDGKSHRLDGPAVKTTGGTELWYKDGKYHRLDGPAFVWGSGDKYWFIEGKKYTEEEFNKISFAILNGLEIFL